jgi:hypothetical protein
MIRPVRLNKFYVETEIVPVCRLWDAEIPTGDPFGGAAYGEKNKKAVKSVVKVVKKVAPIALGIAAAMATGGAAFAAFGALSAGTGTLAAALTAGVAFAGSALSVVGTVTGNEKLTKIGSVLGLAGGVGMVASNTAAAIQSGAGFSDAVVQGLKETTNQLKEGAQKSWGALTGSPVGGSMGGTDAKLMNTPDIGGLPSQAGEAVGGLDGIAGDIGNSVSNASAGLDGLAGDVGASYAGGNAQAGGLISQAMNPTAVTQAPGKGLISGAWDTAKSVGKFVADKENAGLVQLGGNMLTNMIPSEKDQAEQALYEARVRQLEDETGGRERFNSSIRRQSTMQVNPNARVFMPNSQYVPGRSGGYNRGFTK